MQDLFEFLPQLANDLLALGLVFFGTLSRKLLTCAADGKPLLIEQAANLANHQHVMPLVIPPVTSSLHRFELGKLLLPIAKHVGLDAAELAHLTDRKIPFARYRGQINRTTGRFQHKSPPLISVSGLGGT